MSMSFGALGKANAEINVTPLIDVLLVLLIIFMVILPQHRRGEPAEAPTPNTDPNPTKPTDDAIVLQLLDAGNGQIPTLQINGDRVGWDTLEGRLEEIFHLRSERAAFLKGDPEIDFQYVADALDIAHQAGIDRVGLIDVGSASTRHPDVAEPRP